jgi:diguanylate cyclase (GGDEF)-like protein
MDGINVPPISIRVLLIEDDADFANILKFILHAEKDTHFEIESVPTLEAALDILHRKQYDLALLDLGLPDSRGVKTFERFAEACPEIPVVILSGIDDEHLALEVVKKGAQDYMVKGNVDRRVLVRILNYAVERHHQKKQVEELNKRLERLSLVDPLTQLLNRRGLEEVLAHESGLAGREGWNLAVILLDLDNFKPINDSFGHATGDIVLQEVAKALKNAVRNTDYVARVGGDEFVILLPDTRRSEAVRFSERVRLSINRTPVMSSAGQEIRATASLGVVTSNRRISSIETILEETHAALAKSKQLGKNRVSFGEGHGADLANIAEMLKQKDSFKSVKQAIRDLETGEIAGYEFLTRTSIPGFEMPEEFLNFSRENNLLSAVDHRCLEASLAASYTVPAKCEKHVNIFPSTMAALQSEEFGRLFPPPNLCGHYYVEISEQQILGDPSYLLTAVQRFKKRGIRIAIDDVGFGRSCLESLIVLQPDVIKIDKRIVQQVKDDKSYRETLKRLLNVLASLDAKVIAEGVETQEELDTLKELGVRYGQGFLWGQPA